MRLRPALLALAAGALLALGLTACSSSAVTQQPAIAQTKQVTEYPDGQRGTPVDFTTDLVSGTTKTAADYRGKVLVVNFWYASCPPCRAEAKDLQSVSRDTKAKATFLGVNVRDEVDTITAYDRTFGVTYDTTSDVSRAAVQLAFAGTRGPNATPTTLVVDPTGRVSARILGQADPSTLRALIRTAAE